MIQSVKVPMLTPVQSNNPLTYYLPAYLSPLSGQKKIAVVLNPAEITNDGSTACSEKPLPTSYLYTALKVATYILTAFTLPLLALLITFVVRKCYKFHYVTAEMQLPSMPPALQHQFLSLKNWRELLTFKTKCAGAEKHVEDLIRAKGDPAQCEAAISSYIDGLIQERTALQVKAARLENGVSPDVEKFLETESKEILGRLLARKTTYRLDKLDKEAAANEANYQKGVKLSNQQYQEQLAALERVRKAIEAKHKAEPTSAKAPTPATSSSFLARARQAIGAMHKAKPATSAVTAAPPPAKAPTPTPAIPRTFLTETYPHVIDKSTFTHLGIFQIPGNKVQVEVISSLFGKCLAMTVPHDGIEWRTSPTPETMRNPAYWALDGAKVIFRAS